MIQEYECYDADSYLLSEFYLILDNARVTEGSQFEIMRFLKLMEEFHDCNQKK